MLVFSICLTLLFDRILNVSETSYARVLNMPWYNYNNIIFIIIIIIIIVIVTNFILEFLSARFVHPVTMQLTI